GIMSPRLAAALAAEPQAARAPPEPARDPPLAITRITTPIVIDGVMDDPAWENVPTLPLTMYAPVYGGTMSEASEMRVAYDDQYFYAGGWFYDRMPEGIRINSLYRDRWNGDDTLAIYIDAFNDNQNA